MLNQLFFRGFDEIGKQGFNDRVFLGNISEFLFREYGGQTSHSRQRLVLNLLLVGKEKLSFFRVDEECQIRDEFVFTLLVR